MTAAAQGPRDLSAPFKTPLYRRAVPDLGFSFRVNWISVWIFLALAIAIALYATHVAGGWMRPWLGIKPVWWLLLIFVLPWIGIPLLIVNLVVHRRTPGAIRGRSSAD